MLPSLLRLYSRSSLRSLGTQRYWFSSKMTDVGNGEPATKKMNEKRIGTHDGTFHCDEALACFMLKSLPDYENASIVRSRDKDVLDSCDIVVDVGGVYDRDAHRYDHHQRSFDKTINDIDPSLAKKYTIKLSSAGLVYAHFGRQIVQRLTSLDRDGVSAVYEKLYEYFIQEIDAIDNGIPICDGEQRYVISTNLSSRVGNLNPAWNDPSTRTNDEIFRDAVALTGAEFMDKINYYGKSWWPAKSAVKRSIEDRYRVHPSGKIVELEGFVPWKQHFFDLEREMKLADQIQFFLFKDKSSWRVICVPVEPDSFVCRKFLKEEWWGERDQALSEKAGIPACVFCHHTGFIGGNATREGALEMAIKSL